MTKFVSISTAISAIQIRSAMDPNGRVTLVQRTVAIDEHGQGWELETNGLTSKWNPLPMPSDEELSPPSNPIN